MKQPCKEREVNFKENSLLGVMKIKMDKKAKTEFNKPASLIFLLVFWALMTLTMTACSDVKSQKMIKSETISDSLPWSERMALSIMKRHKYAWQLEDRNTKKWSYTHGLVSLAFLNLWQDTGDKAYYDYAKGYADEMINEKGEIYRYDLAEFNIDHINPGKILFDLYAESKDERYKTALETLRYQLDWQPRNTQGGFWHKLRYPWQMWLDGLYMGAPFYARYTLEFGDYNDFDDIANQFILMYSAAIDQKTGLLYHGWDESKVQEWADKETGLSPHFWGRAIGWYAMGIVDVLDYFPEDHPKRQDLINILEELLESVSAFQDDKTGLWSQVMNLPEKKGNYHEATVSAMLSYVMIKGYNNGYLDEKYLNLGKKAFDGITLHLIKVDKDGEIHLTKCCAVAGLGGNPYRDGSYDYYVNEEIRDNDPKGTGPFILAALEFEKAEKKL